MIKINFKNSSIWDNGVVKPDFIQTLNYRIFYLKNKDIFTYVY